MAEILLVRVHAYAELFATRNAPDVLRQAFSGARITALAVPGTGETALLEADPRLDGLLFFPAEGAGPEGRSLGAFRRLMAAQRFAMTVVCVGDTPLVDYRRHLAMLPLCPGRKFLLAPLDGLFPMQSPRGLRLLAGAALSLAAEGASRAVARLRRPRKRLDLGPLASEDIRRILWVRLDHIGDVALSLPALNALKEAFPNARLDALVLPGCVPLLADLRDVSEVLTYDAPRYARDKARAAGPGERRALVRRLRQGGYDLAVDMRGDDTARRLAVLSGARRRLGPERSRYEPPARPNLAGLMTDAVSLADAPTHDAERDLFVLRAAGFAIPEVPYRLEPSPVRLAAVWSALEDMGVRQPYAVLHARPGDPSKAWPPERFAAVADHLVQRHGLDVLLSGSSADKEENARILAEVTRREHIFDVAGRYTLADLPALFQPARLMVTVDTGPMHIAAMVGTPVVALFLPGHAAAYHPYLQPDSVITPQAGFLGTLPVGDVIRAIDCRLDR